MVTEVQCAGIDLTHEMFLIYCWMGYLPISGDINDGNAMVMMNYQMIFLPWILVCALALLDGCYHPIWSL